MSLVAATYVTLNFLSLSPTYLPVSPSGPLLYHYADIPGEFSLELSWDDVLRIARDEIGFDILVSSTISLLRPNGCRRLRAVSSWTLVNTTTGPCVLPSMNVCLLNVIATHINLTKQTDYTIMF